MNTKEKRKTKIANSSIEMLSSMVRKEFDSYPQYHQHEDRYKIIAFAESFSGLEKLVEQLKIENE